MYMHKFNYKKIYTICFYYIIICVYNKKIYKKKKFNI